MLMLLKVLGTWIFPRLIKPEVIVHILIFDSLSRVPVRVNIYSGLPHAFWIFPDISTTQVAENDLLEGVRWLVNQI